MITVHGASGSPFVRKVLAVLAIKNVPYEQVQQMPFTNDAQFRKISPLGKIPVLIDGDLTICDSKVICEYLEAAYPEIPVFPSGLADSETAQQRADALDALGVVAAAPPLRRSGRQPRPCRGRSRRRRCRALLEVLP